MNPDDVQRLTEQLQDRIVARQPEPILVGKWSATKSTSWPVTKGIGRGGKKAAGVGGAGEGRGTRARRLDGESRRFSG